MRGLRGWRGCLGRSVSKFLVQAALEFVDFRVEVTHDCAHIEFWGIIFLAIGNHNLALALHQNLVITAHFFIFLGKIFFFVGVRV